MLCGIRLQVGPEPAGDSWGSAEPGINLKILASILLTVG